MIRIALARAAVPALLLALLLVRLAGAQSDVPGVVVAHSPAATRIHLGSLSIAILDDQTCVASHQTSEREMRETGEQVTLRPLGPEFRRERIPIEDGHLSCLHRPGGGPPLILIPGTFSDHRVYTDAVRHLDPKRWLVIVENRGLGGSWPPPENGSIEQCARDVIRVADHLGVETFYIGGHSLGGMIAIEVGRLATDRVRGIVCIEGWTSWRAARDAFGYDMKSTLTDAQLATLAAYREQVLERWSAKQVKAFGRIWRQWDGTAFLERTQLPVLSMWGDRGKTRPALTRLRVPDRDNIQIVWFESAAHVLLLQRPREVAESINAFIARVEARPAGGRRTLRGPTGRR
jgi:pimeloyl-ACP methyl ester carboxylesterase